MKLNKTILVAALGFFISTQAMAGQQEINQIEQAASTLDTPRLQALAKTVSGYDLALAEYRLALSFNLKGNGDEAKNWINQAMATLESLEQTHPENAEVKALLAQVYGYKIALEPMKGIYYGPKSNATLAEAESLAPNNPRVHLIKGIGKLNTPPLFGGSVEEAEKAFAQALTAFEQDQYSNYHWGQAETYTWKGLVKMRGGDIEQAKQNWQMALQIDPNYGWAKSLMAQHQ